jgi:hypothetical protein
MIFISNDARSREYKIHFNNSVADAANLNNSNTRNSIIIFPLLVCMETEDNFNTLIYDIHLKSTLRRDRGSFVIDEIMR